MTSPVVVANNDPAAIESGNSWNGIDAKGAPVVVTFSFPTTMPAYDQSIGGFTASTVSSFTPFTPAEQTQALTALGQWAAASGIVFVQVAPGQGDITFGNISFSSTTTSSENGNYQGAAGIGFYPFGNWSYSTGSPSTGYGFTSDLSPAGAIFMNSDPGYVTNGQVNFGTLLHEIGHAIGLKHPDQIVYDATGLAHNDVLNPSENSALLTIMSETGDDTVNGSQTLFALDKAAAADLYGPAGTGEVLTGSGTGANSVSSWSWDASTETLTQTAVSANETIHGTSVNDIIYGYDYNDSVPTAGTNTLFGLDGVNWLYAGSVDTNLYGGPGENHLIGGAGNDNFYVYSDATTVTDAYTSGNNALYAFGVNEVLPENVDTLHLFGAGLTGTGNDQNDSIYGDGVYSDTLIAGGGDDYMVGGSGGNRLVAGTGVDTLYGGTGANTFVFGVGDGTPGPNLTAIGDFKPGVDKIDLSAFAAADGESLFFSSGGSFDDQVGEIIAVSDGNGGTLVEGDFTGSGVPDFEIDLYKVTASDLSAGDFLLTSVCFMAGSAISTPEGERGVETLRPGDLVRLHDGRTAPVLWLGVQTVRRRDRDPCGVLPVRIRAGALGAGVPRRDLLVSPGHALFIEGMLVNAGALVNGVSIVRELEAPEVFQYFHIELAAHALVLAEGVPAESFLEQIERTPFDNEAERGLQGAVRLRPELPYPRVKSPRQLPAALRARLTVQRGAMSLGAACAA